MGREGKSRTGIHEGVRDVTEGLNTPLEDCSQNRPLSPSDISEIDNAGTLRKVSRVLVQVGRRGGV